MMRPCASPPESVAWPAVPPRGSRRTCALVGWPPEPPAALVRRSGSRAGSARPEGGRPKVGLVGFYGPGNYGDELFLDAFREHLGAAMDLGVVFDSPTRPYFTRPVRGRRPRARRDRHRRRRPARAVGPRRSVLADRLPAPAGPRHRRRGPDLASGEAVGRGGPRAIPAPPQRPLDHGSRRGERGLDPRPPASAGAGRDRGRPRVRA